VKRGSERNDWNEQFLWERERLSKALGEITEGGLIEQVEHVGTTSVPGLYGRPCLDIALAIWPFSLEEPTLHVLAALGYERDSGFTGVWGQCFTHTSAARHLFLVEAGSSAWMDYLLMREYLRHNQIARQSLSVQKQRWDGSIRLVEYQEAKRQWFDQHLDDAHRSWIERERFTPLSLVADELRDFPGSWSICGGWAIDLFVGRVTRVHQDMDVAVSRADQLVLQQHMTARGWRFVTPFEERLQAWPLHMRLELPRHQIHAHRRGLFIDFLLTDMADGVWRYRRDLTIIREISRAKLYSDEGLPFLAPELALLFKSRNTSGKERSKDQVDFEEVVSSLEPERRAWLRWALIALDPSHSWIEQLEGNKG
jgi:GrpB-like predicted nucleotidyltransferase (UPF0157 family)